MQLLETIEVQQDNTTKRIELYQGDLSKIPAEQEIDILVVSAYPNNYANTPNTLIGALSKIGISVANLSSKKAVDLRQNFSCWLSHEIPNATFKRILCFEPQFRNEIATMVGEIFQSLMPFVFSEPPIKNIAMPLVATGNQGQPIHSVLAPLVHAAYNWLQLGLPVQSIKIVEYSAPKAQQLLHVFRQLKSDLQPVSKPTQHHHKYDLFISYSHQNKEEILFVEQELKRIKPDIRLFLDLRKLDTGMAWQEELYAALDNCETVVAFLSPPYLSSKVCKEEFNIALFRHRDSEKPILLPINLYTTELPTYMKLVQYSDCREYDQQKLKLACRKIVTLLSTTTQTQYCPICNTEHPHVEGYPDAICESCYPRITDAQGHPLHLLNTWSTGQVTAIYAHNSAPYTANAYYIDGSIALSTEPASFGGLIFQVKK